MLLLVLSAVVINETLPPERRSAAGFGGTLRAFGTLLRDRGYVGCVLAGAMVTAAMFGYISASPFLLQERFGLSAQWFSACFALNAVGIILATQVGRMLLRMHHVFRAVDGRGRTGAGRRDPAHRDRGWSAGGWRWCWSRCSSWCPRSGSRCRTRRRSRWTGTDGSPAPRQRCSGLTQFALGAITAPLVGIGDVVAGTALGVTALGATLIAVAALFIARPAVQVEPAAPAHLAPDG